MQLVIASFSYNRSRRSQTTVLSGGGRVMSGEEGQWWMGRGADIETMLAWWDRKYTDWHYISFHKSTDTYDYTRRRTFPLVSLTETSPESVTISPCDSVPTQEGLRVHRSGYRPVWGWCPWQRCLRSTAPCVAARTSSWYWRAPPGSRGVSWRRCVLAPFSHGICTMVSIQFKERVNIVSLSRVKNPVGVGFH